VGTSGVDSEKAIIANARIRVVGVEWNLIGGQNLFCFGWDYRTVGIRGGLGNFKLALFENKFNGESWFLTGKSLNFLVSFIFELNLFLK
jgi:hypothetical protein